MVMRAQSSAKKSGKQPTRPKRKASPQFTTEERELLGWIRSTGLDRPVPYDEEDDEDEPSPRREIVHPVLGKLRWDDNWQGHVAGSAFGRRVPLLVEVFDDYAEASPEQCKAFAQYRDAEAKAFAAIERMLFDYYVQNLDELRSYKPAIRTPNKKLPDLKKPAEIWKLAKVEAIVLPIQEKKRTRVAAVDFKTAWDCDHGTRAVIENGKAKRLVDPGEGS
jgi:hypothetical protein